MNDDSTTTKTSPQTASKSNEGTVKTVFKIVGVIQILFGLPLIITTFAAITEWIALISGNNLLEKAGVEAVDLNPMYFIGTILLSGSLAIMYFVSAYGLFKMKTWEFYLMIAILVLTFLQIIYSAVASNFNVMSLLGLVAVIFWGAVLFLVLKNKELFAN